MEVSGQLHILAALPPKQSPWYPCGPQSRSRHCEVKKNLLHLSGIELWHSNLHPVAIPTELSRLHGKRKVFLVVN
jgi:hypothetical protein